MRLQPPVFSDFLLKIATYHVTGPIVLVIPGVCAIHTNLPLPSAKFYQDSQTRPAMKKGSQEEYIAVGLVIPVLHLS